MRWVGRREIQAPAELVWTLVSVPEQMNRWLEARVVSMASGDAAHPGTTGALRAVDVRSLGNVQRLDEVVFRAEPPRRLCYRVYDSALVRRHRGDIRIEGRGGACSLHWQVDIDFAVAGVAAVARRTILRQLDRSLDRLVEVARGGAAVEVPALSLDVARDPEPRDWMLAEEILQRLRALGDELDRAGDHKRWFPMIYTNVTENLIESCRSGELEHPQWALRLIPHFYDYFADNLRAWREGRESQVEGHWRRAFSVMDRGSRRYPGEQGRVIFGMILGINAHVEDDLPRTLAQVYVDHYADQCHYARFRADYLRIETIFADASRRMRSRIPRELVPLWARAMARWMPPMLAQKLEYRRLYDLPTKRRRAFDMGERMASMLLARRSA